MSDSGNKQTCRMVEKAIVMPKKAVTTDFISLLLECRVTCEHRADTRAADCIVCPNLAGISRNKDGKGMRVRCFEHVEERPRFARGTLEMVAPIDLDSRCSACKSDEGVLAHPEMVDVYFCESCVDQMSEPIDWLELGTGD